MKNILFLAIITLLVSCKPTEVPTEDAAKILTTTSWKLDRFSNTNSKTLSANELNSSAAGVFGLEFEFLTNNRVRGRNKDTKEILNAGTWYLTENNTALDIDVTLLKADSK